MALGLTPTTLSFIAGNGSPAPSAGVTDVLQNGVSVVDNGVARVTVPTKTSDLQNDSGFVTAGDIPAIPTKTSELQNDSGFVTSSALPTVDQTYDATSTNAQSGVAVAQAIAGITPGGSLPPTVTKNGLSLCVNEDGDGVRWEPIWRQAQVSTSCSIIEDPYDHTTDIAVLFSERISFPQYQYMSPWFVRSGHFRFSVDIPVAQTSQIVHKVIYAETCFAMYENGTRTIYQGGPLVPFATYGITDGWEKVFCNISHPFGFASTCWGGYYSAQWEGFRIRLYDADFNRIQLGSASGIFPPQIFAMAP